MIGMADEISRFPVYELDDHGSRSTARHLVATSATLKALSLFLETFATDMEGREATHEDQDVIRGFVGERLKFITDMLSGAELRRPEWPGKKSVEG